MKTLYPLAAAALAVSLAAGQAAAAPTSGSNPLSAHIGKCVSAYTRNETLSVASSVLRSVSDTQIEVELRWEGQNYPVVVYSPSVVVVDPLDTCLLSETPVAAALPFDALLSKPRE